MVSIVSFSSLLGNLVIKSRAIVSKGSALGSVVMGYSGGLGWVVLGLVDWQVAHPFTKSATSCRIDGHQ